MPVFSSPQLARRRKTHRVLCQDAGDRRRRTFTGAPSTGRRLPIVVHFLGTPRHRFFPLVRSPRDDASVFVVPVESRGSRRALELAGEGSHGATTSAVDETVILCSFLL